MCNHLEENIIEVRHLDKAFGGLKILQDVNFDVKRGEKLALIGPNGAGKSTLLNTIGGQGPATGGVVNFNVKNNKTGQYEAHDITKMAPNKRLHLGLGRSYQVNNLFWQQNILQNVLIALYGAEDNHMRLLNVLEKREDLLEKAEELLRTIDMWDKREESPTLLSYGEQRMLEMLLAFTANPSIVLLDEPSAGLPTAEAGAFIDTLKKLAGETNLLYCAPDMELVFQLADRIMVLYFGQILRIGSPEEISNDPKVQEIYLGGEGDTYDAPVEDKLKEREKAGTN